MKRIDNLKERYGETALLLNGMMVFPSIADFDDNFLMRFAMAALCAAMLAGCGVEADFSGDLKTETLQAEKYQSEIASIDQLLFREKPLGEEGVRSLESTLDSLSTRVAGANKSSRFLKLESLELKLLAKRAGRLPADGTGAALQNDWMRIRNNLFDDRAWFVRSAADLDYAAKAVRASSERPAGSWRVVSITANGRPRDDPEMSGSIWTFEGPQLTIRDGTGQTTTYSCGVQDGYLGLTSAKGEGWVKFELEGDVLRLAFFDGLKGKPESFEPVPGQNDPLLIVARLEAMH